MDRTLPTARRPRPTCARCCPRRRLLGASIALALAVVSVQPAAARAQGDEGPEAVARRRVLDVSEYRLEGVRLLSQVEVEVLLAPFLGPARSLEDVEKARGALERAYSDKGYQSVTVAIPPQKVKDGVVTLKVIEGTVGRLRVRGSRWYSLLEIKNEAPSLAEGTVPNFNEVVRDLATLNQLPDRRVTPALRAGVAPHTVDVDLNVVDHLPLHGALEFNNRYSAGTSPQRLSGSLRYDNLWQQGHSLSLGFQIAPNRLSDARVFSMTYLARFLDAPWVTLSATGVLQDSDISTLGAFAVQGRGRSVGARLAFTLPGPTSLFHGLTLGLDYKYNGKEMESDPYSQPISSVPASAQYAIAWAGESSQTQASATVVFGLRGLGSNDAAFDAKRYKATGSFLSARLELSRLQEFPGGAQVFVRLQGFFAYAPLVPAEQATAGGQDSVRGYLEAQAAGDRAAIGSIEARSPSVAYWLGSWAGTWLDDLRIHAFAEGARVALREPLPEQQWLFFLWSAGGGARFRLLSHLGASFDVAVPLRTEGPTQRYQTRLQFRLTGEF